MIGVDATFDSSFTVEPLEELPPLGEIRRFYFPGASSAGGRDGVLIKVTPGQADIEPWVGVFAFGLISPKGVSGIFTCPNCDHLCVVARGAGYIVTAANPSQHELVEAEPVMGVYPVASSGVLVFADYLRLTAYSQKGRAWRTARLSWDGLQIDYINDGWLRGKGWSSPENRHVAFTVDLRTGVHEGGASPPSG